MSEEFIDWLCWMWAQDGQRFYPPEETALECVEAHQEMYEQEYESDESLTFALFRAYEWEVGQHSRAYINACEMFRHAEERGLDPVERAAREHRRLMQEASANVEPLNWSWYNE